MKNPTYRVILFFLLLIALMILPLVLHIDQAPYHPLADYTDLLTAHWPNFYYVKSELKQAGEFPLWNAQILSGAPLVADPLFSLFYPPFWIAYVLPILPALNILFWLHLTLAGVGFTLFMHEEGLDWTSSLIAGVAFGATPKLIGHIGLGHLTLVCAVAWTPWILRSVRRTIDHSFRPHQLGYWALFCGALHGLVFLIDPRWLLPLGLLSVAYGAWRYRTVPSANRLSWSGWIRPSLIFAGSTVGIAAVLLLPLYEFVQLSTRAGVSVSEASALSLPFSSFLGLVLPNLGGSPELLAFFGLTVITFAVLSVVTDCKGWRFWLGVTVLSLAFAFGDQLPIYPIFARIVPGFRWMRVPARFAFITALALSALLGLGAQRVFAQPLDRSLQKRIRISGFGINLLIALLGLILLFRPNEAPRVSGILMVAIPFGNLILIFLRGVWSGPGEVLLGGMLIIELLVFNWSLIEVRPMDPVIPLPISTEETRVFSTSYSLPQDQAVRAGIQLSDGVNPLQLSRYWSYMAEALGFDENQYSVTLPPYPDGDPTKRQSFAIDVDKLNRLNIGTILSEYPLSFEGMDLQTEMGGTYIYNLESVRPRAWIETSSGNWENVERWTWSPNHIEIYADGPGTVVLSEVVYPGWRASVDGVDVQIQPSDNLFRSVELGPGEHEILFVFRPWAFYLGLGITVATLLLLGVFWRRG